MTVDQMCKHCNATIQVAFGKQTLKMNFLMRLLGKMLKNKAFNTDFGKNSPTAKEFKFESSYDFESAEKNLLKVLANLHKEHKLSSLWIILFGEK